MNEVNNIKNIPKEIYLVVGCDKDEADGSDFNDLTDVLWSKYKEYSADIKYTLTLDQLVNNTTFNYGYNEIEQSKLYEENQELKRRLQEQPVNNMYMQKVCKEHEFIDVELTTSKGKKVLKNKQCKKCGLLNQPVNNISDKEIEYLCKLEWHKFSITDPPYDFQFGFEKGYKAIGANIIKPKSVQKRGNIDLLELVCQLHSRSLAYPSEEMHNSYIEARQELEKRLPIVNNISEEEFDIKLLSLIIDSPNIEYDCPSYPFCQERDICKMNKTNRDIDCINFRAIVESIKDLFKNFKPESRQENTFEDDFPMPTKEEFTHNGELLQPHYDNAMIAWNKYQKLL